MSSDGAAVLQPNEFAIFTNAPYGGFSVRAEVIKQVCEWYKIPKAPVDPADEEDEEAAWYDLSDFPIKYQLVGSHCGEGVRVFRPDCPEKWTVFFMGAHEIRLTNDQDVVNVMRSGPDDVPYEISRSQHEKSKFLYRISIFPIDFLHAIQYTEYDGSESVRACKHLFLFYHISKTEQGQALLQQFEATRKQVRSSRSGRRVEKPDILVGDQSTAGKSIHEV